MAKDEGKNKNREVVKLADSNAVAIPSALRKKLDLKPGDFFEATTDGKRVILTPVEIVEREKVYRVGKR